MERSMSRVALRQSLHALGRRAALRQDEQLGSRPSEQARRAFLQGWGERKAGAGGERHARRTRRRWPIGVGALAAAAAAAVGTLWLRPAPAFSFTIREQPGQVGAWMVSNDDLPVVFSDGTSLTLGRDSLARVTSVSTTGAEVTIPQGHVRASVTHTATSRWTLDVGPFVVHVTGTRFDTSWDASQRLFSLEVHEGSVFVTGCSIDPRPVGAGSSIRMRCEAGHGQIEGSPQPAPTAVQPPEQDDTGADDAAGQATEDAGRPIAPNAGAVGTAGSARETEVRAPTASWRELAAQGRSHEALAAALGRFDDECRTASASDVLMLADQARYAGDAPHARTALMAVRSRFPGSAQAATAAFLLGRMAFDAGNSAEAATWFERASVEAPGGPLAREAAGRLIEARENAGDHAGARAAAERYLQRYPSGPHASLAIRVLEP
jgi:ferric-dicitrate binding protein FerR (iron transport regulator)